MSQRIVKCSKYGKELPGLEVAPVEGELGQEIFEKVSAMAWGEWTDDMMIKIINEYRLDLVDIEHYNTLIEQMRAFLNLASDEQALLEVENAERGGESS